MSQKNAAIITKNNTLCRLLEAELMLYGFTVTFYSGKEKHADAADIEIVDCTESSLLPITTAPVKIAITNGESSATFTHSLPFPFLLSQLDEIIYFSQKPQTHENNHTDEKHIHINKAAMTATLHGNTVKLSEYELRVLKILCESKGECVSRERLNSFLGADDGNIADVYICHLRKKLESPNGTKIIYTVRGKGYKTDYILQ